MLRSFKALTISTSECVVINGELLSKNDDKIRPPLPGTCCFSHAGTCPLGPPSVFTKAISFSSVKPFKSSTTRPDKHSLNDLEHPGKIVANRFSQKEYRRSVSDSSFAIILMFKVEKGENKK
jgi:hypothetical protein